MLLILGTFRINPRNLAAAKPVMQRMADSSRREDGCLEYVYAEDVFEPGLIHVKERWSDQQALDQHFASEHIAVWRASWSDLDIGQRDLHLFEVGQSRRT